MTTFLDKLLGPTFQAVGIANGLNPLDDRYFNTAWPTIPTAAGVPVGPETALKISTVYACDRLISETIAMLPTLIFQRQADGGQTRATRHPLYDVLARQPNVMQTAFEFFDFMTHCVLMRGNAYARIVPGARGFCDQLKPLHPDRVTPERLDDDTLRYRVRRPDGTTETINGEDVFHLRGMSADGVTGTSVINYAKESFGLSLGAEHSGARLFGNNSEPGGVLKTAKKLSPEGAARLKSDWEAMHSGPNQHRVAVLEEGLEWQSVAINHKDAQFLETREFQAEDAARWFRVPPHMVGLTSKATSWGSGIEQMGLGFITYTLGPWIERWQQAITRDLILAPQLYFVEFVTSALLMGDMTSRYNAYAIARNWGWYSANDVRRREGENPIEGGDVYLQPSGSVPAGTLPPKPDQLVRSEPEDEAEPEDDAPDGPDGQTHRSAPTGNAHYQELLREAAGRVVRKEIAAMTKAAKRVQQDTTAWFREIETFYGDHADFVAQTLRIPDSVALRYATNQAAELRKGYNVTSEFESASIERLVSMALEA